MPAIPVIMLAVAAAGTAAATVKSVQASKASAETASRVAAYNSAVDQEQAKQNEIDTSQNILRQRAANRIYLSRQQSAIAANGLLASGSPLDLMAETAKTMESNIQDEWHASDVQRSGLYSAAAAGIQEGRAQSDAFKMQGETSLFQGVGQLASMGSSAYGAGAFGKN